MSVKANAEEKSAKVIVPDNQLSLAIGKEGQNARLAARLTGFKIDIKSERQAREAGEAEEKSLEVSMPEETVHADDQKEAAENMSGLQEL